MPQWGGFDNKRKEIASSIGELITVELRYPGGNQHKSSVTAGSVKGVLLVSSTEYLIGNIEHSESMRRSTGNINWGVHRELTIVGEIDL